MIKNIVFDFGGVLCDLDFEHCMKTFEGIGLKRHLLKDDVICTGIFQQFNMGTITEREFLNGLRQFEDTSNPPSDKQLLDEWNGLLLSTPPQRFEALKKLYPHYSLYLLSNVNVSHWEYSVKHLWNYEGTSFLSHFKKIFLSYEMHKEKPNADIFEEVIKVADILPEESLFVDDRADNTTTAERVGFHTLQALGDEWINKLVGKKNLSNRKWTF